MSTKNHEPPITPYSPRLERFREHVAAAGAIYYRMDSGQLTGRNSTATDSALRYHIENARRVLSESVAAHPPDPLPEYLDSTRGRRLSEKWRRLERRYYGLG